MSTLKNKRTQKVQLVKELSDKTYHILLAVVISLAFVLRFTNLGFNSLWLDEATTSMISLQSFQQIWDITVSGEFNPPLFYWMEHIILMFGNTEFILRFIPAILGVLTIPAIYYVSKEFLDRNVGIIAATAFAFSPFLILYSQEARAYAPMLFFITVASIFYFKALKSNSWKDWVVFGALSSIAFWCHFYAMVIIVSYIVYALMINYMEIKKNVMYLDGIIKGASAFIILSAPLIVVTISLFGLRTATGPTFGVIGADVIIETFRQISGFSDITMYLFLMLFVVGVFQAYIIDKNKGMFFVWMMVSIFIVSYFLSFKIPMVPRYLQFINIIFFMGIGLSYKVFQKIINSQNVVYILMGLFVVMSIPFMQSYYSMQTKDDWRGFSSTVTGFTKSGDYVVFVPAYIQTPMLYYYSNETDGTMVYGAYNASQLDAIQQNNNRIYYVVTMDIRSANPDGDAIKWIDANSKPVLQNGNIYLFRRG